MKKLLFIISMMLPFIGIGQITILNDNLIKQKFPNEIAGVRDIDRLTRDDPNFSGAFTVDVLYFEGEEFKSNGVFIDYYVDEEDEDGGVSYSAPKRVRFASYNIKTGEFSYPTVITYYRNGKIKEIEY